MGSFVAYGKMPALGDFLRLGAEPGFVTPWDLWLQGTLLAARQNLGPRFEACYMSAPVWRFSLPPGVAGPQGAVGVLMPSVDRVGRQFPLTLLAQTGQDAQAPLRNLIWQSPVLDAVEALALDSEMEAEEVGAVVSVVGILIGTDYISEERVFYLWVCLHGAGAVVLGSVCCRLG